MRTPFDAELNRLQSLLQEEGEAVRRSIRGCVKALEDQDAELADEVIAFDDEIDRLYLDVEAGIQSLLARQTPVASDLRLLLAMIHVNLPLQRVAGYRGTVAQPAELSFRL